MSLHVLKCSHTCREEAENIWIKISTVDSFWLTLMFHRSELEHLYDVFSCRGPCGNECRKSLKMKFNQRAGDWLYLSFNTWVIEVLGFFAQILFIAFLYFQGKMCLLSRRAFRGFLEEFNATQWVKEIVPTFLSHCLKGTNTTPMWPNWDAVCLSVHSLKRPGRRKRTLLKTNALFPFLRAVKDDRLWPCADINACCWNCALHQVADLRSVLQPHGERPKDTGWVNGNARGHQD